MSDWGKVPREVFMDSRLTRQDIRVLGILCAYANGKTGVCTRRQEAIAEEIEASREGVNRSLKKLVSLGYVKTKARAGMKRSLEYCVLVSDGSAGQLGLFDAHEAPRSAKPKAAKRDRKITSVVTPEVTSVVTAEVTAIEQTPVNRGCAAARDREPANDLPKIEPQPDAVPASEAPGAVPTSKRDLDLLAFRLREAAGDAINSAHPAFIVLSEPIGWLVAGCDLDADILPTIAGIAARPRASPVKSWAYFAEAVRTARDRRLAALQSPNVVPFDPRGSHVDADRRPPRRSYADEIDAAFDRRLGFADPD